MSDSDLFSRNLEIFEERFPDLHARLKALATPISRRVEQDGAAVDINLRSGLLYKQDARTVSAQQVDEFVANPLRLFYSVPTRSCFDSKVSARIFDEMMLNLRRHDTMNLTLHPCVETGYLVILGVGLGYHIPRLLDSLSSKRVVIVEPFEEFLFHSLHSIDWSAIVERCDREGRSLHLFCAPDAQRLTGLIGGVMGRANPTLLDGTYLYTHYPLWELNETRRRIINEMPRRMIAMGYFEDERKMLCNTASNLHKANFRLFEGKLRRRDDTPVFLVGSGPSLDQSMDVIRQWRDHAIIISAGSSLPLLVGAGIVPDFHCELENGPEQYQKTKHTLERFPELFPSGKLSGVRLIASSTMNPQVPTLFEETLFYFREAVTSTTTFAGDYALLRGAAPTCANTALAAAACMGLGDIYLFGYDCGWRDSKEHHAKESIYFTNERFKNIEHQEDLTLPGNFGGTVGTNLVFDWSRNILQQCIRAYYLSRVFNCSDGALIEGTIPKVPEALEFTTPVDRPAVIGRILGECPSFPARTFLAGFDMNPVAEEMRRYVARLDAIIDHSIANGSDFGTFVEDAWQLIREISEDRLAVGLIYFSTVGELKQSALFINRIADAEARRAVTRDFLEEFRALHHDLLAQSLTLVDEIADWLANRSEPEWSRIGPPA